MQHLRPLAPLLAATLITLVAGPAAAPQGPVPPVPPPAPVRDSGAAPPQATGTASISGSIVVADSGQPARKARVTLRMTVSENEMRGRTAITDDMGRFAFTNLAAGRYMLTASKSGHVGVTYGQRKPGAGRPGTPIHLADDQKLEVQLQMPRGGVITGTVLDERGEAVPGTPVRAMRFVMQGGRRTLQQGGSGSTDDRGVYRIYGLQPGEYLVAAIPRNSEIADMERIRMEFEQVRRAVAAAGPERAAEAEQLRRRAEALQVQIPDQGEEARPGYAPVYYPGTTAPASAGVVNVGAGEEKTGVDFQMQLVNVARVEGVIVTSTGQAAQNIQLSLVNAGHDVPGVDSNTARPDREGRFRFSNVAPGQYLILARATIAPARGDRSEAQTVVEKLVQGRGAAPLRGETTRLWAMTDVSVDGRDVSNLVVTLQPGMTVSGRVAFEGSSAPPADLTRIRVVLSPVDASTTTRLFAAQAAGRVDAGGRFSVSGVAPGRYRLTGSVPGPGAASTQGQGWTLGSSVVAGEDSLDEPFEVKPNENVTGAVLTFTDRQTELSGTLVDEKGQPAPDYTILIYPVDRELWLPQSRRIQSTRPATDGRYSFRNLPAGEYRVSAVLDPEPGSWYDPQFLTQMETASMRVPLGPGEKKVQNLRVGGM